MGPKTPLYLFVATFSVLSPSIQPAPEAPRRITTHESALVLQVEQVVAAPEIELPEDVPYWPTPYDTQEFQPQVEAAPSPVLPLQELVQRVMLAPVQAVVAQVAPRLTRGGITTDDIVSNARSLLGVPYRWGGNTTAALDCSAYVSRVWGVSRQTTDTVGYRIDKEELQAGDVLNLTRREDPRGYGHVRLFDRWANPQHTRMWVFEETPPRAIYHQIAYDPRYTPMRKYGYEPDESYATFADSPAMVFSDNDFSSDNPLLAVTAAVLNPRVPAQKPTLGQPSWQAPQVRETPVRSQPSPSPPTQSKQRQTVSPDRQTASSPPLSEDEIRKGEEARKVEEARLAEEAAKREEQRKWDDAVKRDKERQLAEAKAHADAVKREQARVAQEERMRREATERAIARAREDARQREAAQQAAAEARARAEASAREDATRR